VKVQEAVLIHGHLLLMGFSVLSIGLAIADHKRLRSARTEKENLPFSDAVWAGNTLYISGHLGLDPATGRPPAGASDEAEMMLDAFKKTVETAGLKMQDLVFIQIFCSDVSLFSEFNVVYRAYFNGGYPARAFLGSGKLLFDARFEIQGIAVKRG
jgi:2-iminobutanoate/2-iminopropanoate deaminase